MSTHASSASSASAGATAATQSPTPSGGNTATPSKSATDPGATSGANSGTAGPIPPTMSAVPQPLGITSDLANAKRLAKLADGNVVMTNRGLYVYDTARGIWVPDTGQAGKFGLQLSRDIDAERLSVEQKIAAATNSADIDRLRKIADALMKGAFAAEQASRIRAATELMRPMVHADVEFNKDPMLFNVVNGTLDLETMKLRPHDRGDFITQVAGVAFDWQATAPRWNQAIAEIFNQDQDLIDYVQMAAGYSLTGEIGAKRFHVHYGTGDNGKNTYNDRLLEVMGTYGGVISPEVLGLHRNGQDDAKIAAEFLDRRLVVAGEPRQGLKLNEALVKRLTGDPVIRAKLLYRDPFDARMQAKTTLTTNFKPEVLDDDPALWARMVLIPFLMSFTIANGRRDDGLAAKLQRELPGILNWMLQGLARWHFSGRNWYVPPIVQRATDEYRSDEDRVADFIAERVDISVRTASTSHALLYDDYKEWARSSGYGQLGTKRFGARFVQSSQAFCVVKVRNNANQVSYQGARLRYGLQSRS